MSEVFHKGLSVVSCEALIVDGCRSVDIFIQEMPRFGIINSRKNNRIWLTKVTLQQQGKCERIKNESRDLEL